MKSEMWMTGEERTGDILEWNDIIDPVFSEGLGSLHESIRGHWKHSENCK